jgi:hypothetical protein
MGFPQRKGSATITRIPIGLNLFSAQHAAKKPVKSKPSNTEAVASDNPIVPSTPASATPSVSLHHPPYAPFLPSPYGYPSFYPFPQLSPFPQPNFFGSSDHAGPSNWGKPPPQPPSSPPPAGSSLDDFCNNYGISFGARIKLDELGFEMGDDLSSISQTQYESAGFKHLEWNHVLKAYKKYKYDQK